MINFICTKIKIKIKRAFARIFLLEKQMYAGVKDAYGKLGKILF